MGRGRIYCRRIRMSQRYLRVDLTPSQIRYQDAHFRT